MLKQNSEAWQLAKKLSKRRYSNSIPIELLPDGSVKMQSLIRGNTWLVTLNDLRVKVNANK